MKTETADTIKSLRVIIRPFRRENEMKSSGQIIRLEYADRRDVFYEAFLKVLHERKPQNLPA